VLVLRTHIETLEAKQTTVVFDQVALSKIQTKTKRVESSLIARLDEGSIPSGSTKTNATIK